MIRILEEQDKEPALQYLCVEPAINVFIIGDIEGNGMKTDFQTIWGDFSSEGKLEAVLLQYHENFVPYSHDDNYNWSEFKKIILKAQKTLENPVGVSGKETILKKFNDILPEHERRTTFFCELKTVDKLILNSFDDIKIAQPKDADRVYTLIDNIEEFNSVNEVDRIRERIESGNGRIYYIEEKGEMTTVCQTTAESSLSAMIIGVATLPASRNKGQMSRCLSKLCKDAIEEGKSLCLFYDNPSAGRVYHKLGFETLDNWMMISKA